MDRLLSALERLIAFFDRAAVDGNEAPGWSGTLRDIRGRLASASSRAEALRDLESCFGGMGSLNDYVFSSTNGNVQHGANPQRLNRELEKHLDRCYMELRLLNQSPMARLNWRWLALWQVAKLPPRVKNAFER